MKIWLDDIRDPPDETWTVCRTANEAWQCVRFCREEITEMSLDHDLGDWEPSGYEFVCWMEANDLWPDNPPNVHSSNPAGAKKMRQAIDRKYRPTVGR